MSTYEGIRGGMPPRGSAMGEVTPNAARAERRTIE